MKAWHKVLLAGFVASAAGIACTVTSDDGGPGGFDGGGSNTGGSSSGGSPGSGGGSTGGSSSTGGSPGTGGAEEDGGSGDICDSTVDPEESCFTCFQARCTQECNDCPAGSVCEAQLSCITQCTSEIFDDLGVVEDTDIEDCANDCIGDAGDIAIETNDALVCMRDALGDSGVETNCGLQCLNLQ